MWDLEGVGIYVRSSKFTRNSSQCQCIYITRQCNLFVRQISHASLPFFLLAFNMKFIHILERHISSVKYCESKYHDFLFIVCIMCDMWDAFFFFLLFPPILIHHNLHLIFFLFLLFCFSESVHIMNVSER